MISINTNNRPLRHQVLPPPAEGQTEFKVTAFTINDHYLLLIDDVPQTAGSTRSGQVITYAPGVSEGARIVVYN